MDFFHKVNSRLNIWKTLKAVLIFLIVFSIAGFLVLPPIIKSVLIKKLSETLHREVAVQSVRVNPFMLSVTVKGLEIRELRSKHPFFSFDELYLNLQTLSIFRRGVIVKEVRLVNPYLSLVRNDDLTYNFSDLLPQAGPKTAEKKTDLRFSVNNIQVISADIDFMDVPKDTKHTVKDASLTIPFVSNLPYYLDAYVQPAFSAVVNGHGIAVTGNTKPFVDSLETNIDITVKDLDIPHYLAYSPVPLDFRLVSGFFGTRSSISYIQYKDRTPTLSLKGSSSLRDFRVTDKADGHLISLPLVEVVIGESDLMATSVHFSKIAFQSPEVTAVLDSTGHLNLMKLVPANQRKPADSGKETGAVRQTKPEDNKPLPVIEADEVTLTSGKVMFADSSGGRKFSAGIEDIQATVTHFSTVKEKKTDVAFSCRTDTQEELRLESSFSVEPLAAEGKVDIGKVVLKKYAPYYQKFILFAIEDGVIDLATQYEFRNTDKEPELRISGLSISAGSLRLRKHGEDEDFLRIPSLSVSNASADLAKKEAVVEQISTQKGFILARRYTDGNLNFGTLLPAQAPESRTVDETVIHKKLITPAEKPWTVTAKKISVDRYAVKAEDRVPSEPVVVSLDRINFRGENISTQKNARGKVSLSLQVEKKGALTASGPVSIEPISAQLKLVTKSIPIMPAVSYFSDMIKFIVLDGSISSDGALSVRYARETGPKASYKGTVSLNHFASVDKADAEDLLKWNSLYIDAMDISYQPLMVNIGEVALSDFYARIIIHADGSINLQNIMVKEEQKNGDKGGASETSREVNAALNKEAGGKTVSGGGNGTDKKMVRINKVTLQGGTVNFSDRYIKPNFTANMLEIGGRVTGLSSEETTMAEVDLRGKLDNYAPLEITGRINPLRDDLFIDLKVSFKDMDLSPLTPYSGRYLGYVIEKGKLTLNLQYLIEKKKLDSQNKVLLDQFTLGNQVDSPEATKLPVKLAIALLKNRRGEIDLDIPVSGQIDDPQFSIGRIILKILVNLLAKAATSPFALLGAVFGGGEELSYVEFDAGLSRLNEQGVKKLDTLVKALHDRPSLKIDIEGHADPEKDREGLKQNLFNRKVKAQKLKESAQKGAESVSVDEIRIEPAEYPKYLKAAYKEEKFPKPRNLIGMAKDLPVPEMEKLMLTHIEVKDDDLRRLASQRAIAVKDHLLKSTLVEQERIFIVEPKTLQPEKKETVKNSRVDFRLK